MNKITAFVIVLIGAIILISAVSYAGTMNQNSVVSTTPTPPTTGGTTNQTSTTGSNSGGTGTTGSSGITLAQLASHDSMDSCWVAYQGNVYDITSFLPVHPGSPQAILPYCGTSSEFAQAFTQQHGTSQVRRLTRVGTFMGMLAN